MKRRLVAVTLSLIMTMATVSEAGAATFTSPDTDLAVATQTDAEEVNDTEETSETGTSETETSGTEADDFQMEMMGQQYHHRNRQMTHLQRNGYGCFIAGRDAVNSRCYGCRWSRCSES